MFTSARTARVVAQALLVVDGANNKAYLKNTLNVRNFVALSAVSGSRGIAFDVDGLGTDENLDLIPIVSWLGNTFAGNYLESDEAGAPFTMTFNGRTLSFRWVEDGENDAAPRMSFAFFQNPKGEPLSLPYEGT